MAIKFAIRGDTTVARYALGEPDGVPFSSLSGWSGPQSAATTATGVIGDSVIQFSQATASADVNIHYQGNKNTSDTMTTSILMRGYLSTAAGNQGGFYVGGPMRFGVNGISLALSVGTNLYVYAGDGNGESRVNGAANAFAYTAGSVYDFLITDNGQDTAGSIMLYVDGVTVGSINPTSALEGRNQKVAGSILIGNATQGWPTSALRLNEFVIWDEIIDPSSVTLVDPDTGVTSTGQSLNGSSRTGWVDVGALDGSNWTSITAAQIANGINQVQAGLTQTGTLVSETWSTISANEIKSGVNQIQNSTTVTGTYLWTTLTAADVRSGTTTIQDSVTITGTFAGETWTTITAGQILSGVEQIQNGTTVTGTLSVPIAASGVAGTLDLNNIKEQVQFVLEQANTTTASPVDLSANLSNSVRVQNIMKVNPNIMAIQASALPAVSIWLDDKSVTPQTMAANQLNQKREAVISLKVAGIVWNNNFEQFDEDPSDNDIEYLMENIELTLRAYANLNSNVTWQHPSAVTYHNLELAEETHLRVGIMDLEIKAHY